MPTTSARILALRPDGVVPADRPGASPAEVLAYLRGVEAGDRHGYRRGRAEGLQDMLAAFARYFTTPLRGK